MNAVTLPERMTIGSRHYTRQQLDLIWRTAAKDCNQDEFSKFVHVAGHLNLDPMRKQVYAFVFNKDKPSDRSMAIVVGIDGYRTVARRTGDYRPDDEPPRFTTSEALKSKDNPAGLIDCEVKIFFFSHGEWHKVPHKVEWSAYAPMVDEWAYNEQEGKRTPTGKLILDPKKSRWHIDGKGMLAKCCEAGAIRKAFPDDFSGVYEPAELDKANTVDLSPAEYAEAGAIENRLAIIGGKDTLLFDFCDERGLHPMALGKIHGECAAFLAKHGDSVDAIETWRDRNQHQLKEYWARAKSDALDIKGKMEAALTSARAAAKAKAEAAAREGA